ncbi:DUF600 family protein [Listeria weihenstephanensis]|uniref:DUF600 family protein n=1 Tax=Listeria weihenstephanensis TaxID=1006155 RepID=A0A841Z7M7_9LIST|nr:immunity protein YezG family protein [Listeria weihenstephanensis]MBC1500343.1 DUF600 family protein [Listeria weihenstephanensis]
MNTENMERLYQEIANHVMQIIPEEWDKFLLYSEVDEERDATFFYYYPKSTNTPIYSLEIEDMEGVNEELIEAETDKLDNCLRALWNEFIINKQEAWKSVNFTLDSTGSFEINYSYDALDEYGYTFYERVTIWKYEKLGILPKDNNSSGMRLINEHIKRVSSIKDQ